MSTNPTMRNAADAACESAAARVGVDQEPVPATLLGVAWTRSHQRLLEGVGHASDPANGDEFVATLDRLRQSKSAARDRVDHVVVYALRGEGLGLPE